MHGRSEGGIVLILTTYESDDQILAGVRATARGNRNPAIGRALFLSKATVKTHLGHVFEKLGVNDRTVR
ncbi:response regulator transcription factor [Curtobacterium flaccumfaciens]|uniref:response regulator transcription factor n=1 Tax=Curtobacterium flaccumfaciens TaxID=2035 RepID=UPI00265B396C|nr:LuxR C-terminal-related transcriptional regulator [Curtobacterium flaccumfaciens]MCS5519787.1 LuxR C-terminal-related transcriptional regulator [Curtobacterium flaccumfaciens]